MKRLLLALLLPALLPAQNTSCSLSGTVQDPAGALVPNAKVTLTGEQNGFVRTTETRREGFFSFPDLTPASFTIAIEAPGFKTYKQTGILISADEQRSLGQVKLSVGQVTESITVAADAVTVNTATGERAGILSGEQLDQIALRGRDVFDAISLMPGVVDTSDGRDAPGNSSINNIFVLGGRNDQKNVTVDGVTNLDTGANNSTSAMPSMDAVAEVKVLMSAYSAENGRNPTSINVITKGGGTSVHGQTSFYVRNEALNANSYFSNAAGRPKQRYRYNIGSYSVGGPMVLPKILPRRKNVFFFFSQEFQNQLVPYPVVQKTVPTALERKGDFSQSYNTNGSPIAVNDPLNGKTKFPGNQIPASRLTPIGQAILNLFPLPNFVDSNPANRYNWNYYAASSSPYNRRTETARLDWSPMSNWQIYLSGSHNADSQDVAYNGGNAGWIMGGMNFPLSPMAMSVPGRLATLHSTNSITPTLFNELSLGGSHNNVGFTPKYPEQLDRTKLGINLPQRNPSLNPLNLIPVMSFGGIQNAASPAIYNALPYQNGNSIYSVADNLSKIAGRHTLKMGLYYEHTQKVQQPRTSNNGTLSFNGDANNPLDANNAYANALLGNYGSYAESTAWPRENFLYTNTEWFIQDEWKARNNLSLSYGVRFYHDPPLYDGHDQLASFSPAAWNPAQAPVLIRPASVNGTNVGVDPLTGKTYPYGLVGNFVPGVGDTANGQLLAGRNGVPRGVFQTASIYVAPRLGFAWDPFGTGKTSIRGGGGIYFDRISTPQGALVGIPPFVYTPSQYYGTFADIGTSAASGFLAPSATSSMASVPHQPQTYNFNLQIDRKFGSNLVSVGYTGSLSRHLLWQRNINAVPLGAQFLNLNPENKNPVNASALPTNFLRPYPAYGDILMYEFASNSNYNALLTSFQHRVSHGLTVVAQYTFSKVLDMADGNSTVVDPFASPRSRNYGPAGFNRAHVFSSNFYYTLPKLGNATGIRPLGWIADHWSIAGVVRMLTGAPLTPGYSLVTGIATPTGSASVGARMQVVDPNAPLALRFGPPPEPAGQATAAQASWLVASTAPQLGNLGQNTVTGPGTNNWDLSIYRTIPIRERARLMLRFETYNTFNHTQFNAVNSTAQFNAAGQQVNAGFLLPTASRPPRYIQIAIRVTF